MPGAAGLQDSDLEATIKYIGLASPYSRKYGSFWLDAVAISPRAAWLMEHLFLLRSRATTTHTTMARRVKNATIMIVGCVMLFGVFGVAVMVGVGVVTVSGGGVDVVTVSGGGVGVVMVVSGGGVGVVMVVSGGGVGVVMVVSGGGVGVVMVVSGGGVGVVMVVSGGGVGVVMVVTGGQVELDG